MLCSQNDILSFPQVLIALIPPKRPYSTTDQSVFVKKSLFRRPPFSLPEFAETVRLYSGTSLHHRSINVTRQVGQVTASFNRTL